MSSTSLCRRSISVDGKCRVIYLKPDDTVIDLIAVLNRLLQGQVVTCVRYRGAIVFPSEVRTVVMMLMHFSFLGVVFD